MTDREYTFEFTVFTPTYNRGHLLHRVYESLQAQTLRDFEWLIVDDGSTDDTKERVEKWKEEPSFVIRYFYQENQGKHVAMNRGVQEAEGRFFLTLDSDDRCLPEALERLKHHWDAIPEAEKSEFSAVTGLCEDEEGDIVGDRYPEEVFDSTPQETQYRYGIGGEKWGFQRTDVMKEFPFPEIETAYLPESIVWHAIGEKYKTRYINEVLRVYSTDDSSETITGDIVKTKKYAKGAVRAYRAYLNDDIEWFGEAPLTFLKWAVQYARYSFHTGQNLYQQMRRLENNRGRMLWVGAFPCGLLLYLLDVRAER